MCTLYLSKTSDLIPNLSALALIYSIAIVADSFITFPRLPVIERLPFPFDKIDSINNISPPTRVQAKPVTTPATLLFSYLSRSNLGLPKISTTSSLETLMLYSSSIAIFLAAYRTILATCFSRPRTPDSRV